MFLLSQYVDEKSKSKKKRKQPRSCTTPGIRLHRTGDTAATSGFLTTCSGGSTGVSSFVFLHPSFPVLGVTVYPRGWMPDACVTRFDSSPDIRSATGVCTILLLMSSRASTSGGHRSSLWYGVLPRLDGRSDSEFSARRRVSPIVALRREKSTKRCVCVDVGPEGHIHSP